MDIDLELSYRKLLIELAHCCLKDGYDDEAAHLLNRSLGVPPSIDSIAQIATNCRWCFRANVSKVFKGIIPKGSALYEADKDKESDALSRQGVRDWIWTYVQQIAIHMYSMRQCVDPENLPHVRSQGCDCHERHDEQRRASEWGPYLIENAEGDEIE